MRPESAQLAMGAAGAGALLLRGRIPTAGSSGRRRTARWARRRDVGELAIASPVPGRITLGTVGRQLLAVEPRHSVCVLGPTGSGKTLSVVEPALLEWPGPAVVTTVKVGVLQHTGTHRATLGDVLVYDPTGSTGRPCSTWSPLQGCADWPGAWRMAGWLVEAAGTASDGRREQFWTGMARKLLAPLLYAAGAGGGSMADVVRWVDMQEVDEVRELLLDLNTPEAKQAFHAATNRPKENVGGSSYATAEVVLDAYADPQVAISAASCDITPGRVLDSNGTLYLVAPAHAQTRLRPLFEALIMSVIREAQDRAQAGRTLDPGLLLLLDEAGNTAPLRDLPSIASTGREQGIQVISAWQDMAQVHDHYGRQASTVVNNHRGKLGLAGISDLETLDYLSRLLGDADVDRASVTRQAGGQRSTSISAQQQRLAPADMLRQLPLGQGVLVYGSTPPAKVKLRRADRGDLARRYTP